MRWCQRTALEPCLKYFGLVLILGLFCSSCVPWPHRSFRTPVITGHLYSNGAAIAGNRVRAVAEPAPGACTAAHALETTTDSSGRFELCPIPDFRLFLRVMAHRTFAWHVCAETPAGWTLLSAGQQYTLVDTGPRLISNLSCELDKLASPDCEVENDVNVSTEKALEALRGTRCEGISPLSERRGNSATHR